MHTRLFLLLLTALLHAVATWYWGVRFTPGEVAKNDADITADGALDTLRRAYHAKRSRVRGAVLLGLAVGANLPLAILALLVQADHKSAGGAGGAGAIWCAAALSFVALGWLLAAFFGRYFTPWLNLKRMAGGRTDIGEWYASPESASWPDAACWKEARDMLPGYDGPGGDDDEANAQRQALADQLLQRLLTRTWLAGRLGYAVGVVAVILTQLL